MIKLWKISLVAHYESCALTGFPSLHLKKSTGESQWRSVICSCGGGNGGNGGGGVGDGGGGNGGGGDIVLEWREVAALGFMTP